VPANARRNRRSLACCSWPTAPGPAADRRRPRRGAPPR
jgi:hypothetical protein